MDQISVKRMEYEAIAQLRDSAHLYKGMIEALGHNSDNLWKVAFILDELILNKYD